MKVVSLHKYGTLSRANPGDAGLDLRAAINESFTLYPGDRKIIPTGVAVAIKDGWVGMVCPRSGLAAKYGVTVVNSPGIIDSGYRGEIKVILSNTGVDPFFIEPNDRIAQFVITPCALATVEYVQELDDTVRGITGFGDSGVK